MITNERMPQEPINYIVMPAIYQHSYELKKVGHRQFYQPTNGLAVATVTETEKEIPQNQYMEM